MQECYDKNNCNSTLHSVATFWVREEENSWSLHNQAYPLKKTWHQPFNPRSIAWLVLNQHLILPSISGKTTPLMTSINHAVLSGCVNLPRNNLLTCLWNTYAKETNSQNIDKNLPFKAESYHHFLDVSKILTKWTK